MQPLSLIDELEFLGLDLSVPLSQSFLEVVNVPFVVGLVLAHPFDDVEQNVLLHLCLPVPFHNLLFAALLLGEGAVHELKLALREFLLIPHEVDLLLFHADVRHDLLDFHH